MVQLPFLCLWGKYSICIFHTLYVIFFYNYMNEARDFALSFQSSNDYNGEVIL